MGRDSEDSWFKRTVHGWSWLDTFAGFCLGIPLGVILGLWWFGQGQLAARLLVDWSHEIVTVFLILVALGRLIAVSRWPRRTPIDYNKITPSGVVAANFVSLILGGMILIGTLALVAPGAIEKMVDILSK